MIKLKKQVVAGKNSKKKPPHEILVGRVSTIGGTEVGSSRIPVKCKCKESTTPKVGFRYKSPEPTFSHTDLHVLYSFILFF